MEACVPDGRRVPIGSGDTVGDVELDVCVCVETPPPATSRPLGGRRSSKSVTDENPLYVLATPPACILRAARIGLRVTHGITAGLPHSSPWWTRRRISRCSRSFHHGRSGRGVLQPPARRIGACRPCARPPVTFERRGCSHSPIVAYSLQEAETTDRPCRAARGIQEPITSEE